MLTEMQIECTRWGGWISGAERFDPRFFGVSAAEASATDPQQRLLLEISYSSLHGALHRRSSLMGGGDGVLIGIERPDWTALQSMLPSAQQGSAYAATGSTMSVASGRISFALGLQGPCVTVDTACSAAMTAIHTGAPMIRQGECSNAIAGGVALKFLPYPTLGSAAAGMLSKNGRCFTYDARANGYVRSDGVSTIILTLPEGAGAVLASSAVRSDGRSASLTAPNGGAQRSLMLAAWGSVPSPLRRLDALSLMALARGLAIRQRRVRPRLCSRVGADSAAAMVGAAKASVGHTEAASGMAGVLKATAF